MASYGLLWLALPPMASYGLLWIGHRSDTYGLPLGLLRLGHLWTPMAWKLLSLLWLGHRVDSYGLDTYDLHTRGLDNAWTPMA